MTKSKCIIYARKSTESEDKQIQSIPDQLKTMAEIAARENLEIIETIFEAKSAKTPHVRAGFKRLIELIEKGKADNVLCWKLDRLARNPIDGGTIHWLLQSGKIACIKTSDRNYFPEENALLISVEMGMANQYSRDLSKNVKRGMHSNASKGWLPSKPPVGYLNAASPETGERIIIADPERFNLVRKMWDLMLTGLYSQQEILRIATYDWKLDSTKRGKGRKRPIVVGYIYHIFQNIFYTGNFYYGGKYYKGKHQPMVSVSEFEKVQNLIKANGHPKPISHKFAYTGSMTCGICNGQITATIKKKLNKSTGSEKCYIYYHCGGNKVGFTNCRGKAVSEHELERQIGLILNDARIDADFYELGLEAVKTYFENDIKSKEEIATRQRNYKTDLQKKLNRLTQFLLNETLSEEQYVIEKTAIEEKLLLEERRSEQIESSVENIKQQILNSFHFCKKALEVLKSSNHNDKRAILKIIGSNRVLNGGILLIDKAEWLLEIEKVQNILSASKPGLEPESINQNKSEIEKLSKFSIVCTGVENIRNILAKSTNAEPIPDLSLLVKKNSITPQDSESQQR